MNIKKLHALIFVTLTTLSSFASAGTILFDPEQDGTFFELDLMNTQLFSNGGRTSFQQYFGGDFKLNAGDKFKESYVYNYASATGPGATVATWGINDLNFSLSLAGEISSVVYGVGVPDLADRGNFGLNLALTSYMTDFYTSAMDASVALTIDYQGVVIGEFDIVNSLVTGPIALDGSNVFVHGLGVGFTYTYAFDTVWAAANQATIDNVWRKQNGDLIDIDNFSLESTRTAGAIGDFDVYHDVHTHGDGVYIDLDFQDSGRSTFIASTGRSVEVPEPSTLAIFALGIIGLASRRLKKQ